MHTLDESKPPEFDADDNSVRGSFVMPPDNKEEGILMALAANLVTLESFLVVNCPTPAGFKLLELTLNNSMAIVVAIGKAPKDLEPAINTAKEKIASAAELYMAKPQGGPS